MMEDWLGLILSLTLHPVLKRILLAMNVKLLICTN